MKKFPTILEKFFEFCINICSIFLALLILFASLISIYISVQKEKAFIKISHFVSQKLEERFEGKVEIPHLNITFEGVNLIIKMPQIRVISQNQDAKISDITVRINYFKILFAKIEPEIEIQKVDLNLVLQNHSSSSPPPKFLYLRAFNIFLHELNLNISHNDVSEKFVIYNIDGSLMNDNFEEISFKTNFGGYLKQGKESSFFYADCGVKVSNLTCSLEILGLQNSSLKKFSRFFNYPDLVYLDGDLKNLEVDFIFENKLKSFNLIADTTNLKIQIPQLMIKKPLFSNYGSVVLNYKDDYTQGFFKLVSDKKIAFGEFTYDKNGLNLDVVADGLKSEDIGDYWPKRYLFDLAQWLESSIYKADVSRLFLHIKTPIIQKDDLVVDIDFTGANLHYSDFLPDVTNANGNVKVDNSSNVVIEVSSGRANNLDILPKTQAIFDTQKDELFLDIKSKGLISDFISFFTKDLFLRDVINQELEGQSSANVKIKIPLSFNLIDIYDNVSFKGNLEADDFLSPIFRAKKAYFTIDKKAKQNASLKLDKELDAKFLGLCESNINAFDFSFLLDLKKDEMGFKDISLLGNNIELAGDLSFNFNFENVFDYANFKKIKMCEKSDFAFYITSNDVNILGKSLDYNQITSLPVYYVIKKFQTANIEQNIFSHSVELKLESLYLLNNVSVKNINFSYNASNNFFNLESNIASGFKNNSEISIKIEDLGYLLSGISTNNPLKNGKFALSGKVKNQDIIGKFSLKKYQLELNSMDLGSKEMKGKFKINKEKLELEDVKLKNAKNTLILSGFIGRKNLDVKLEIFYTPSSMDINSFLDLVPGGYASDAFDYITFGTLKKGLFTLIYEVEGDLKNPVVVFKGGKTSKGLLLKGGIVLGVVTGFNPILLPVLGVLAIF
jgi:hypothetical protein